MAEVENAKRVLAKERRTVLRDLRRAQAARVRALDQIRPIELEMGALFVRGKAAGLTVVEMAEAIDIYRQFAYQLMRAYRLKDDIRKTKGGGDA